MPRMLAPGSGAGARNGNFMDLVSDLKFFTESRRQLPGAEQSIPHQCPDS